LAHGLLSVEKAKPAECRPAWRTRRFVTALASDFAAVWSMRLCYFVCCDARSRVPLRLPLTMGNEGCGDER